MIENNRPVEEITEALELVEIDYKTVVEKHEALVEKVDDEEFAKEEKWIEDCREKTLILKFRAKDYILKSKQEQYASIEAFGTCAYSRWPLGDGTFGVTFIAAKSRVAPLKQLTIPRLELQAAVLATRLGKTIAEESRFQFEKVVYFLDSMIVIGEIQSNSDTLQWKHIPGEVNVADAVSRGISVQDLTQRWKSGPDFLSHPEEQWPEAISAAVEEKEVNTERRKTPVVCTVSTTKEAICCTNISSWRKLVEVTVRIQKLGAKVRSKREGSNATIETENHGTLTPNDLYKPEVYWIKQAQKDISDELFVVEEDCSKTRQEIE
ncbi:PREDICTED: uncharacterized protein LOC107356511 [Paramuricea clavata]|uniref:PREDICTED: uncharacterized protein LOC107356511 n=1 Tax=Paramuricea clavata TaxID=317549 RepID=A0A6S7G548_PARCT|nr:PREDICTED: uncharacterized protein LOC107356511 [Paramuricea clavata]